MNLVYRFQFNRKTDKNLFEYFTTQCQYSANLYNQALELISNGLKAKNYENISTLDKKLKALDTDSNFYRKIGKAKVSQQTIKVALSSYRAFFKCLRAFKKEPSKFKGRPKEPQRKARFPLIYDYQSSSIKNGRIYFSKKFSLAIPQYEKYKERIKNFKQIRVNPKERVFIIEITYNFMNSLKGELDFEKYASIDLGVNNLCTLYLENDYPELISGRDIKSVNYFYNKQKANWTTSNKVLYQKKLAKLSRYRENFINDKFHKISKYIIQKLIEKKIRNLVIGYNKGWKDNITLGKKNNQKFSYIPFYKLINMICYKCELHGIKVNIVEESYTSKCDALAFENIGKHEKYAGKRVKRGLFKSATGKLLNADVNGALNILRKYKGDGGSQEKLPAGYKFLLNPKRIRIL